MTQAHRFRALLLSSLLGLTGCGGGAGDLKAPEEPKPLPTQTPRLVTAPLEYASGLGILVTTTAQTGVMIYGGDADLHLVNGSVGAPFGDLVYDCWVSHPDPVWPGPQGSPHHHHHLPIDGHSDFPLTWLEGITYNWPGGERQPTDLTVYVHADPFRWDAPPLQFRIQIWLDGILQHERIRLLNPHDRWEVAWLHGTQPGGMTVTEVDLVVPGQ